MVPIQITVQKRLQAFIVGLEVPHKARTHFRLHRVELDSRVSPFGYLHLDGWKIHELRELGDCPLWIAVQVIRDLDQKLLAGEVLQPWVSLVHATCGLCSK